MKLSVGAGETISQKFAFIWKMIDF
jgi:hypothetical protein